MFMCYYNVHVFCFTYTCSYSIALLLFVVVVVVSCCLLFVVTQPVQSLADRYARRLKSRDTVSRASRSRSSTAEPEASLGEQSSILEVRRERGGGSLYWRMIVVLMQ